MKNQKSKLHALETMEMSWDLGLAPAKPESLFESDQLAFGHENNNSLAGELFTDFELDLSSEPMNSFLELEQLEAAYTTNFVTQDGQSVVIIIAPDSPADTKLCVKEEPQTTLLSLTPSPRPDPDPEWSPGASPAPGPDRPRKKYARTNPPRPPTGPYPTEKKERKKAQNRTAAFRYREKKKSEQDTIDDELELLGRRNVVLKEKQ